MIRTARYALAWIERDRTVSGGVRIIRWGPTGTPGLLRRYDCREPIRGRRCVVRLRDSGLLQCTVHEARRAYARALVRTLGQRGEGLLDALMAEDAVVES